MVVIVVVGALLLLGIAVVAVAWPLVQERRNQGQAELALDALPEVDPLVDLYAQRDSIYQAIRELRFDHQVGKVSDADYKAFDSHLRANAAAVLKQIDALKKAEADPALDASLEAEIAALRQVNGSGPIQPVSPAALAPAGKDSLNFCPQCGQRLQPGSRFCGACGAALT
jgi:hypothetical protein